MNGEKRVFALAAYVIIACITICSLELGRGNIDFWTGLALGSCFAFSILAGAWSVFGPGTVHTRVPMSGVMLVAMPLAIVSRLPFISAIPILYCAIAIFVFTSGLGLLLRVAFHVLLRKTTVDLGEAGKTTRVSQYGIKHLMILTTSVAILLAMGRLAIPDVQSDLGREFLVAAILVLPVLVSSLLITFSVLALDRIFFPTIIVVMLSGIATFIESSIIQSLQVSVPIVWINTLAIFPVLLATVGLRLSCYRLVKQRSLVPDAIHIHHEPKQYES